MNNNVSIEFEVLRKTHNIQDVDNSASQNVRTKQPPLRKAAKKVNTELKIVISKVQSELFAGFNWLPTTGYTF